MASLRDGRCSHAAEHYSAELAGGEGAEEIGPTGTGTILQNKSQLMMSEVRDADAPPTDEPQRSVLIRSTERAWR